MSQFPTRQFEPQTGQVPFQVSSFSPITIYDAPGQLFSQLWDREFSIRGARNVFLAPENLTPKERDTIHTRLKAAAGNNSVTSALIDIALNPWVWLFLIASPVGAEATGSIFKVASKYSSRVLENSGMLGGWGLLSANALTRDTAIGAAAADVGKSLRKFHELPTIQRYNKVYEQMLVDNGLDLSKGLNHTLYAGEKQRLTAFRIGTALRIKREGLSLKELDRQFVKFNKKTGVATLIEERGSQGVKQVTLFEGNPDRVLRGFKGGVEVDVALASMFREIAEFNYKDPRRFLKLFRGHADRNTLALLDPSSDIGRIAPAGSILGQDASKQAYAAYATRLKAGESVENILKEIDGTFGQLVRQGNYFPRNVWETWKSGAKISGNDFYIATIFSHAVRPGTTTIVRDVSRAPRFHPDDLLEIERIGDFRLTKLGEEARDRGVAGIKASVGHRTERFNYAESIERYVDSEARTFAMFLDDVGDETLAINRRTRANVPADLTYAESASGKRAPLKRSLLDMRGKTDVEPLGGFSHADVFAGEMATLTDKDTIRIMRNNIIPMLMGRQRLEHSIAIRALDTSKNLAAGFAESRVGEVITESGTFGKEFISRMKAWAAIEPAAEVGRDVRLVAKWLYSSHLGFNASSAILNATQPILLTAPFLGAKHVLNGYREYFREIGRYIEIRRGQNFRPISAVEKEKAIRQSFKLADEMAITPDDLETLERITFAKRTARTKPDTLANRILFEYPMKLFAQVEWMNRGVTAHAVRSRWIADRGIDPLLLKGSRKLSDRLTLSEFQSEARRMVDETQFGGHFFNTPEVFLPSETTAGRPFGNVFANPLARQFLQFITKQFVAVVHTAPRLAGQENLQLGFLRQAARGMAFSAVGYELTKNLLNANYERAGFFAASTDFIPLVRDGRFDGTESPVPIPPILQIPIDLVRGFATEDKALLGYAFARTIPGGIGLARLLGIAPKLPDLIPVVDLQRTFVAWGQRRPDGTVPFFRGDGTLIGFESPTVLVLKGLGADLGRFQSQGQLDRFLVAQGEEQRRARREAIIAILGNNTAKAKRIMADFKRRTGFELTISRDQLRSALRMREVGRSERILERMPADSKEIFRDIILKSREEFQGIPREQFESGRTIKERGPRPTTLRLDPNTIKMLQQLIDEKERTELPGSTPGDSGFASFGMF